MTACLYLPFFTSCSYLLVSRPPVSPTFHHNCSPSLPAFLSSCLTACLYLPTFTCSCSSYLVLPCAYCLFCSPVSLPVSLSSPSSVSLHASQPLLLRTFPPDCSPICFSTFLQPSCFSACVSATLPAPISSNLRVCLSICPFPSLCLYLLASYLLSLP